jgi:hypothetical protein
MEIESQMYATDPNFTRFPSAFFLFDFEALTVAFNLKCHYTKFVNV